MKVKELIEILKHIDQEIDILFVDNNGFAENDFKVIGDCLVSPDHDVFIASNHECLAAKKDFIYPMPKPIGYGLFENSIPYDTIINTFYRCCLINVQLGY